MDTGVIVDLNGPLMYDDTVSAFVNEPSITKTFTCRYCGTHYIARDPGFVPNCHNCGSIMQAD